MYNYQGERYNLNWKNKYFINSSLPFWKKNLSLPSENNYLYNNDNTKISLKTNPKLPYINTNLGNPIVNPLFNSYQYENYINPNSYNYYNNPYYRGPKIVYGLPVIIPKAPKYKLAPKSMKKNKSNLVVSNVIQGSINSPIRLNLPSNKNKKKFKLKNANYERYMRRNRTEDNLDKDKKPFFTTKMKFNSKGKWWDLLRYFTEIYYFFSIFRKYTQKMKIIRVKEIKPLEENLVEEIHKVRNWLIDTEGEYWINLLKYKNFNASFEEYDSTDKIYRNSKILIQLIDSYLYNLKVQTNDIDQIPKEIQEIIYKFIKKNTYFPKKYLNFFHIKKLDFDFYGRCLNDTPEESGMILSYFLITSISVQQIFLNIKHIFKDLKPYENITINMKYVASIMYYLQREVFVNKVKVKNDYLNLFNYYRCYQTTNLLIEKEKDINVLLGIYKTLSIVKNNDDINNDIYSLLLIEDKIIDKFWAINSKTMKKISNSFSTWAINLAELLLFKYGKGKKK